MIIAGTGFVFYPAVCIMLQRKETGIIHKTKAIIASAYRSQFIGVQFLRLSIGLFIVSCSKVVTQRHGGLCHSLGVALCLLRRGNSL